MITWNLVIFVVLLSVTFYLLYKMAEVETQNSEYRERKEEVPKKQKIRMFFLVFGILFLYAIMSYMAISIFTAMNSMA